jgi:hypothetical protein
VLEENNQLPWQEIQHILETQHDVHISVHTIIRRANESGIQSYVLFEKPILNSEKAQRRLAFVRNMNARLDSNPALLEKLIFTNETKLRLFENQMGGMSTLDVDLESA